VLGRIVLVLIDAEDDGQIFVTGGSGDDDFLTVVPRWALALVASVKKPVDSTTICAPTDAQSSLAGSRSEKTLICLPSTVMKPSPEVTSFFRLPRIESYLSR